AGERQVLELRQEELEDCPQLLLPEWGVGRVQTQQVGEAARYKRAHGLVAVLQQAGRDELAGNLAERGHVGGFLLQRLELVEQGLEAPDEVGGGQSRRLVLRAATAGRRRRRGREERVGERQA